MRGDVAFRRLPERDQARRLKRKTRTFSLARLDRIDALLARPAAFGGLGAGVRKTERGGRPEPHLARAAVEHETENPGFRAAVGDLQIKASAIRVHAGFAGLNLYGGQLADGARYLLPQSDPQIYPQIGGGCGRT